MAAPPPPDFFDEPLTTLARLLLPVLDHRTPPAVRAEHAAALAALPDAFRRLLALDQEWGRIRHAILFGAGVDDMLFDDDTSWAAGDVPGAPPSTMAGASLPEVSPAEALPQHLLGLFVGDLRLLITQDFAPQPLLPVAPLASRGACGLGGFPREVAETVAVAVPEFPADTVAFGRRYAWGCLSASAGMLMCVRRHGPRSRALHAFVEEWTERPIATALPPLAAAAVCAVLRRARDADRTWYDRTMRRVHRQVAAQFGAWGAWDALSPETAQWCLLGLRLTIGHAARAAEVLDGRVLAAAQLAAIVAVYRAAGAADVRRYRARGLTDDGFDAGRAADWLQQTDHTVGLASEQVLTYLLKQPTTEMRAALDASDRGVLRFLLERLRAGDVLRPGEPLSLLTCVGVAGAGAPPSRTPPQPPPGNTA